MEQELKELFDALKTLVEAIAKDVKTLLTK